MRRTPISSALSVLAVLAAVAAAQQPKTKPVSSAEEKFKPFRMSVDPTGDQLSIVTKMKNGTVNLDPAPQPADKTALDQVARSLVYKITLHELYLAPDGAELTPRDPNGPTAAKAIDALRAQQLVVAPGAQLPPTQVAFTREFGKAAVQAITEVLEKGPPTPIRVNALRMLEAVAESGTPAAWDKVIALLKQKDDKNLSLDVLYYSLRAAEAALGTYDKDRIKWVTKNQCFELVSLVDEVVLKMPAAVAEKTYIPEKPATVALTTDGKPPVGAGGLTREQVEAIRAFRIRGVRALARLRTDVVKDDAGDKERRPLHTLALIALSDPSVSPPPNFKEVGEAVVGLATLLPSDTVNANLLGMAIAKGVSDFAGVKTADNRTDADASQFTYWKVYGARMKAAFTAWEKDIQSPKVKLAPPDKATLVGLSQLCVNNVFDPLTKMTDKGQANINKAPVDEWLNAKLNTIQPGAVPLYANSKAYTIRR